ncbi:putative nucleoside-diphosphate-sugar epimerase [Byssothecium circinans]|uniref:Putative nucleoside-diphosphate-sugar epimerase n=1 Tax=Byssothecium circinans TaxID=147558 RepID=A0A6A5TCQ3_9PLEO|nr:putative nucleoside-diphosphate-sugar epimerase [Byssothecium circinans]
MKIILSGSTGLVGREVIRQALLNPRVTSVIALTRRPIDVASIAAGISRAEKEAIQSDSKQINVEKVQSVVLQDFMDYPDNVRRELGDADACIWALALTPLRSRQYPWDEVVRVTKGYCIAGMEAIAEARSAAGRTGEFRFVYVSANGLSRDMTEKSLILGDYQLMRAGMENTVLDFDVEHKAFGWNACIVKPGLISGLPGVMGAFKNAGITAIGWLVPTVKVEQCAKAMLKQCVDGIERQTLDNSDLVRLGS